MMNNNKEILNARLMTFAKWSIFSVLAYYISFLTEQIVGAMKAGAFKIGADMLSGYFDANMARWGIEWSERARVLIFAVIFAAIGIWALNIAKNKGIDSKKSRPLFIVLIIMAALEIFFGFVIRMRWHEMDQRFKTPIMLYFLLPVLLFALVIICFTKVLTVQGGAEAKQRRSKKDVNGFGGLLIIGMLRTFFVSVSLLIEFLLVAFLCIPMKARQSITPGFLIRLLNETQFAQCDGRMLLIILLGVIAGFAALIQIFSKKASFKANVITMEIVNIFYTLGLMTSIFAKYMSMRIDWINFVYIAVSVLFIAYYSLAARVENTYVRTKNTVDEAVITKEEPKQKLTSGKKSDDLKIKKLVSQFNDNIASDRVMLAAPQRNEAKEAAEYGEYAIKHIKPALSVSTDAHYALGLIGGDKAFNILVDELKSHNPKRVNAAATALANMGDMRAVEYIKNSRLDSAKAGDLISFIKKKNNVSLNDKIDTGNPLGQLKEKWTEFNGLKVNLSLGSGYKYRDQQKEALEYLNRYKDQMESLKFDSTDDKLHAWRMLGILLYYLNNPDDSGFYSKCKDAEYCFRQYLSIKPDEADIKQMLNAVKN